MPKKKIETSTSAPLKTPQAVDIRNPHEKLLAKLLQLALEGNMAAAKLYLDYRNFDEKEQGKGETLTPDEAIKLIQGDLFAESKP